MLRLPYKQKTDYYSYQGIICLWIAVLNTLFVQFKRWEVGKLMYCRLLLLGYTTCCFRLATHIRTNDKEGAMIIFRVMVFLTNIFDDKAGLLLAVILSVMLIWIIYESKDKHMPLIK